MGAIMESLFSAAYLVVIITLGILILRMAKGRQQVLWSGVMAIVLGCGDAFHLVPRIWANLTTGTENFAAALGFGTLVTSITMTVFYVIMYHVWRLRYAVKGRTALTGTVYGLALVRIALCLFPQNDWFSANAPVIWGIYRNIPFALLGALMVVLFFIETRKQNDRALRFMWLAITLSFAFYIPVVLWANAIPAIGMLMLPKTCAYVWMIWMIYADFKKKG